MTRIPSPHDAAARALIEPLRQPLYDSEVLSADTEEVHFFQNPLGTRSVGGNVVAGATVVKTLRHTNLETQGVLAVPKLHTVKGIRLLLAEAPQFTSSEGKVSDHQFWHPQLMLQMWVQFLAFYELFIGTKYYARGPGFLYPCNTGLSPQIASVALGQRVANTLGIISDALSIHSWGLYYSLGRNSVTIPPGQSFRALLRSGGQTLNQFDATSFPTGANNGVHRLIYNYLDGVYGKEVQ